MYVFNSAVLDVTGATEGYNAAAQWHAAWRCVQRWSSFLQHSLSPATIPDRRLHCSRAERSVTFSSIDVPRCVASK